MSDMATLHAIVAWAEGFVGLVTAGIVLPAGLVLAPAVLREARTSDKRGTAVAYLCLIIGSGVIGAVLMLSVSDPTAPDARLWLTLSLLLSLVVLIVGVPLMVERAVRGRAARAALVAGLAAPLPPRAAGARGAQPSAVTERLSPRGLELLAADWMRYLGASDATLTPEGRDGGVDVRSRDFVAQVKHYWKGEPVDVRLVRELYGVAATENRGAIFFTSSSYTTPAVEWASEHGVALFIVRPATGRLVAHGVLAMRYLRDGLPVRSIG